MTLKEYMEQRKISTIEMGKLLNCTPQFISLVLKGERRFSWNKAKLVEKKTLGVVSRKEWYPEDEE